VKNWRKMLVDIGGYDNELVGVPSGGVKEMVDEIESLREQVTLLRDALDQLLDDMGIDGHCVCEAAKQQAKEALAATKPKA
jgi:hypothetical protein